MRQAHVAASIVEGRQVEPVEAFGVGEGVDGDDPSFGDGERHDGEGRSSAVATTPTVPFTSTGCNVADGRANMTARPATAAAPAHDVRGIRPSVSAEHDVGVEQPDEPLEVAEPGGGEEGVDHLALAGPIGIGSTHASLHPSTGAAGELAGRLRRTVDDGSDLVERHGEQVVQHERQPFGRCQGLEHDEQREADGVGQQGLVLGVAEVGAIHDRVRHVCLE